MKEYAIGSVHEHDGNMVECVEPETRGIELCHQCYYGDLSNEDCDMRCTVLSRTDRKEVIFKKVEE